MSMIPHIERQPDGSVRLTFPYSAPLIDAIKRAIPPVARSYDPEMKAWTVSPAYAALAARLMDGTFGYVRRDTAGSGPRPGPIRQSDRDYAVLHLLPSAPPELIEAAFRCLSRLHHPDRGGETGRMTELNLAVGAIRDRRAS